MTEQKKNADVVVFDQMADDAMLAAAARAASPSLQKPQLDPSREWATHHRYFRNIKLDQVEFESRKSGSGPDPYISKRCFLPSDQNAYYLTVITPFAKVFTQFWPYGLTKELYPEHKYANDDLTKVKYSGMLLSDPVEPHLANEHGRDRNVMDFLGFLQRLVERWHKYVWSDPVLRKDVLDTRRKLKVDELLEQRKRAEKMRALKKVLTADDEMLLACKDLATLAPSDEEIEAEFMVDGISEPIKLRRDKETKMPLPNTEFASLSGKVFRKITPKRKKMLEALNKVFPNEIVHNMYKMETKEAPLGYELQGIELIILSSKRAVPFTKRQSVLTPLSVASMEVQIQLFHCNKEGRCGLSLQPTKVWLLRQGKGGGAQSAQDYVADMQFAGADDIDIPEDALDAPPAAPKVLSAAPPEAAPKESQKRKAEQQEIVVPGDDVVEQVGSGDDGEGQGTPPSTPPGGKSLKTAERA